MGKGRRRRSYSDSSEESDSDSESASSEADEAGREKNSASDQQEADNWVLCDRCTKWRRVPAFFADQIREDEPWFCELNPNKAFASCTVPQELTNEEIDADADSDGAGESDHDEESLKRRRIPAVWQLLKDNVLAHRKRKVQDEDDIMICHCKPVYRGGDGCGPDCINRMLCIECVPGFCPSEDKCTNQMFSKRMYANLEIRRAGAKGFGLFALEDIKAGQFIIEYIGEVLEEDEYQRRKDYYMSVGQRHYYFMNIGNGEVIDACRKGNISRFINHSCEPNCETQKWLVHGELAIGLFAVRDIPKDTELTFDYNFERYGDKPMRCYCRSTNCRKFIGGMQDNFDVSLLPPVEPDNASTDLPPIMLTDADMDPNMRMLLEWRVGVKVDKAKELGMVTRLERVCKARGVEWSVKHFYGEEPMPVPQQIEMQPPAAPAPATSCRSSEQQLTVDVGSAPCSAQAAAKGKQQRKVEKVGGGVVTGGAGKAKAGSVSAAKQQPDGAGISKLRLDDGAGGHTPAAAAGRAGGAAPQSTRQAAPSATPEVAQVRGPKALFKQWKIMQQQDTTPAPAAEEKPAATPSSPPSPRSPHSPPSPQSPPSPRSSLSLDNDDAALDELRNAATEAAKHVPLRKRLRRLPPKPPPPAEAPAPYTSSGQNGSAGADQPGARRGSDGHLGGSGQQQPATGITRKSSVGSAGAAPASVATALSNSPPRSTSPPPSFSGRGGFGAGAAGGGGGGSRRLRSEIDRRLEEVVGSKGGLRDPSRQNIIKVLRLFNLCDIGNHPGRHNGFGSAAGGRYVNGFMRNGEDGGTAGPGPGSSGAGSSLTARQRARMADLSLLLDVVLKTTSTAAKKELVACGLLTQLHQAVGRNTGKEFCVILRKVLRAVEGLPLEANDVYAVRSAHGNFADMLKQLSNNADYDVRTKATALLKKFPPSAVTDQRLLQLMAAPPVRFGHGRGGRMGGGGGGVGFGGSNGMLPLAMQQQLLQQQQQLLQQQMLKQQQMLRLKEGAMAAAGAGGVLPPPPPLMPGELAAAAADGAAGGLPRSSSTMSMAPEDPMEIDHAGAPLQHGGTAGPPPLGPGRQRAMVAAVAAAALANRPGLFRPMASRAGGMPNGMSAASLSMASGGGRGASLQGMLAAGLSFAQRPPSPANADAYAAAYNGGGIANDEYPYNASKRRKFSHPHGFDDGPSGSLAFSCTALPGPPPRPPYSLPSGLHRHPGFGSGDGGDVAIRDHLGSAGDLPLPPPPPHPSHGLFHGYGRGGSEEREVDQPERISVEQMFALRRPLTRPPQLPPLQGRLRPERHVHGELTDAVLLFALGLYGGSYTDKARLPVKPDIDAAAGAEVEAEDSEGCMSPITYPEGAPMSPLLEPPPPPPPASLATAAAGTGVGTDMPLLPPPPGGPPVDGGAQLRPLRVHPSATLGGGSGPGPSPYHQQGSPSLYSGWDSLPGTATAGRGPASTTSTPTVSGLGVAPQTGAFGPTSNAVTAAANALPPVVPVSSLSEWRPPPPAAANGLAMDVQLGGSMGAASSGAGGMALPGVPRVSPHTTPEHQMAATTFVGAGRGGAAGAEENENIDEWLRPVSSQHAEVWEEPDAAFEAYVADMVRHRLGKYMQPEHPSRVSVAEATMLRSKVYGEVVAKERRAWDDRRRAGVYKPIERHKLEANLKEFVRSTIKRMRDREKEKAAASGAGGVQVHHSGGSRAPGHPGAGGHHHNHSVQQQQQQPSHHRYSLSTPQAGTPPPSNTAGSECAVAQDSAQPTRFAPSSPPDLVPIQAGTQEGAAGAEVGAAGQQEAAGEAPGDAPGSAEAGVHGVSDRAAVSGEAPVAGRSALTDAGFEMQADMGKGDPEGFERGSAGAVAMEETAAG